MDCNDLDKGPVKTAKDLLLTLGEGNHPLRETGNARDHMPRERTHLRYQLYRSNARAIASTKTAQLQHELELSGQSGVDLSKVRYDPINAQALRAWASWEDHHFAWNEVVVWKAREPLALDLAIWFDEELCGLCFANPNNSRRRIRIVRLEGRPGPFNPLKKRIATLSLLVIQQYANILGSSFIEVQEPLQGAVSIYQQLGFYFDAEHRLVKAVGGLVS